MSTKFSRMLPTLAGLLMLAFALTVVQRVQAVTGNERFHVHLTQNTVQGYDWPVGASVTMTIDDPSNGVGTDFTDTQTADSGSTAQFNNVGGIDLAAGMYVTMNDGTTYKDHTVTILALTTIDQVNETVSGTAAPGVFLNTWVQCTGSTYAQRYIIVDGSGNWTADYSVVGVQPEEQTTCNIQPGSYGVAMESDTDSDHTDIEWSIPNPAFTVQPDQDWVAGWDDWTNGNTVTMTVDNDLNLGNGVLYTDSQTVIDHSFWFNLGSFFDLQPGQYVTVTDGVYTKDTQITQVYFDYVNPATDMAGGRGPANAPAGVGIQSNSGGHYLNVTVNGSGFWTADFGADGFNIQNIYDANVSVFDGDGDGTMAHLAPDTLHVVPAYPEVHGHDWRPGSTMTLTIDNDTNPGNGVLYTQTKSADDNPTCGYPCFDLNGIFTLQVGQYVTLSDGYMTKTVQVAPFTIVSINPATDTVQGTASPNALVDVSIHSQGGLNRHVVADGSGNWVADFSVPGDEDFEQNTANLQPGDYGRAIQLNPDASDDGTLIYWGIPPSAFNKTAPANGANNQPTSVTLSWSASSPEAAYEYCIDTTNDNNCSGWTDVGNATSAVVNGLARNTLYYWHARANNVAGTTFANGSDVAYWSFRTSNAPASFNKLSPASDVANQPLSLTISWQGSAGATSYQVCYDTTNDNNCGNWMCNGTSTSKNLANLQPGTTYYWHVRAVNAYGQTYADGSATAYWSFTTGPVPGAFSKLTPASGSINMPASLTLDWADSPGAVSYEFCYDTSNDNNCSTWVNTGAVSQASLTGLTPGARYYWQVRAVNAIGVTYANGSNTAYWNFTIGSAPNAFNKSSPANNATNQPISLTLFWNASGGADSYEYCYDTSNDNACSSWVPTGLATSAPIGGLALNTTYYWQVRAVNAFGATYANNGNYWSFRTGAAPTAFGKSAPANGAVNQPTTLNLTWGVSAGVSYYEYCYDTTNDNACSPWYSNGLSNSKSLSGLATNTTYYWHVRAVNSFGVTYANGSDIAFWSFTTGTAPGAFGKISPVNSVTGQPTSLTLTWGASAGATSYFVCYDTSNDNNCSSWMANGMSTSKTLSGLTPGITYYWQVRAVNSFGVAYADGALAAFWSFRTGSPPSTPTLVAPANNALVLSARPTFDWNNSSLPGGIAFKYYEFQIDVSNTFGSATTYTTALGDITASSFTPPADLARATTYYWRVRALNILNEASAWSAVRSVRIAYAPPTLLTPANGATGVALKPTFTWNAVIGATNYTIQISRYSSFSVLAVNVTVTNPTYTPTSNLLGNTLYYWRVRVNGLFGPSDWAVFSFRTQ